MGIGLTYAGMESALSSAGALLNVVVKGVFYDNGDPVNRAVGIDADSNAYIADGMDGYTTAGVNSYSATGNTKTTYMDLAWAPGGAAWDLN